MRSDGVFYLNIGDAYAGSGKGPTGYNGIGNQTKRQGHSGTASGLPEGHKIVPDGFRRKNLYGTPERLVIALQEDGWNYRQRIPWIKVGQMPGKYERPYDRGH